MTDRRPLTRVRAALQAILPSNSTIHVRDADPLRQTFQVIVKVGRGEHPFVVGWAGEGWPADVKRLHSAAAGKVDVVVARALSEGARTWLADREIGWADESGQASIALPSGLVAVRKVPRSPQVPHLSIRWSPSTVVVAEAALCGVTPRVVDIEQATELSRGATAKALAALEAFGLLQKDIPRGPRSTRRITNRVELLDRYAEAVAALVPRTPVVRLHRLWLDPLDAVHDEIGPALDDAGVRWAVTGAAASTLLAPYLSGFTVVELYVDHELFDDARRLAAMLGARVVDEGHRMEVRALPNRITVDAGVTIDGIRCAAPPRVFADLYQRGSRFAEAANHLLEVLDVRATAHAPGA